MRTLVLDQGYQPHRIVSWQKGIALFFRGKVDVLEEYEDEVHTVSSAYRLPACRCWSTTNGWMPSPPTARSSSTPA